MLMLMHHASCPEYRSHGAVPKLTWSDHRVEFCLPGHPIISLSMDEIIQFSSVTLPITMSCAGNRRKEVNLLKKGVGFHWGSAAISTAYWTGTYLRNILYKIDPTLAVGDTGKYVWMEGADYLPAAKSACKRHICDATQNNMNDRVMFIGVDRMFSSFPSFHRWYILTS